MPQNIFIFVSEITQMTNKSIEKSFGEYFRDGVESFLPHISVDSVVLAYRHPSLQVLVNKMENPNITVLPSGFVKKHESLDEAVYRNLSMLGIREVFMRQVLTFGEAKRKFNFSQSFNQLTTEQKHLINWMQERFVTVIYYGLVVIEDTKIESGGLMHQLKWMDINDLSDLDLDHAKIVTETRKILAVELLNQPVLAKLLPDTFTLNELRGLFEAILNRSIDRGTFRRKMLKLGIIEQVDRLSDSPGRPAHLFQFKTEAYNQFLAESSKYGF